MANGDIVVPVLSIDQAAEHCLRIRAKMAEEQSATPIEYEPRPLEWRVTGHELRAPRELQDAAASLQKLVEDEDGIIDALANDPAAMYQALMASIVECREALESIEVMARGRLQVEAVSYREQLESILALGVPLEA